MTNVQIMAFFQQAHRAPEIQPREVHHRGAASDRNNPGHRHRSNEGRLEEPNSNGIESFTKNGSCCSTVAESKPREAKLAGSWILVLPGDGHFSYIFPSFPFSLNH